MTARPAVAPVIHPSIRTGRRKQKGGPGYPGNPLMVSGIPQDGGYRLRSNLSQAAGYLAFTSCAPFSFMEA